MASTDPLMTTYSAKAPATLVRLFRAWVEATGLRMQDATAAAMWAVMELDGAQRDELLGRMRSWLAEHEEAGGAASDPLRVARARKAAISETLEAEWRRAEQAADQVEEAASQARSAPAERRRRQA